MFAPISDRPAYLRGVRLRPPAIEFRKIQPAVHQHLHAAGAARFPRPPRSVHPEVHALNQMLRHENVVIGKEDHPESNFRAASKLKPLPDHLLSLGILRMSLACKHELNRPLSIRQDVEKPRRIMQEKVWAFVRGKATGKSQSQSIVIKDQRCLREVFRRRSPSCQLTAVKSSNVLNERPAAICAELPEAGIAGCTNILLCVCHCSVPALFSAGKFPQTVCFGRVPGRGVHSVGHVRYRNLCFRPPGKEGLEEPPAYLTVQFAYAVDGAAAADRQIGHIEGFGRVLAIAPPQRKKLVDRNRQFFLGILAEISLDQTGSKAVEARLNGSMGRKEVAGAGDCKRYAEWFAIVFHVGSRTFQHRECGVTFIEMADLGLQAQGSQEPPSSNAED